MLPKLIKTTRSGFKLMVILCAALLLTASYSYFFLQKSKTEILVTTTAPLRPHPKCFNMSFSQVELDKICARGSSPALCQVSVVSHLNHREFTPARLRHPSGHIPMLVHPSWDLISKWILKVGAWEESHTNFIRSSLELLPGAGLLDIGSQLGVYSLHAAQMGRQAVAIDAFYQNSIRLFASATANGFQDRLRVYWNALSVKSNEKMNMNLPGDCNIGGGGPSAKIERGTADPIDVRTATLDDIVVGDGCFSGVKELVVKADIEGNEWLITDTGANVFKRFKVVLIMMEWAFIKKNPKAPGIVQFYTDNSLLPYRLSGSRLQPLQLKEFVSWPWDVFWATKEFAEKKK